MGGKKRVVVAMSGGVDSSVAALLLRDAGYQVVGVTLRLWTLERPEAPTGQRGCCSVEDIEDARRVCQQLGIPHYVVNAEEAFRRHVVGYFVAEYRRGRTPHPCIACNDRIKFDFLLGRAMALGAEVVATGHYARVGPGPQGRLRLLKAADPSKDQSYVLFGLGQEQLRRLLLPAGDHTKTALRQVAREAGLAVADKPDSQEICFVPQGDYRELLKGWGALDPGEVVDLDGRVVGRHPGVGFFTVGQRRGLGLSPSRPLYVVALEPGTRRVVVGPEEALLQQGLRVEEAAWVAGAPPGGPVEATVRVRYRASEAAATVIPVGSGAEVRFREPCRSVTPGQAAVFYSGEEVLGGGFIAGPPGPGAGQGRPWGAAAIPPLEDARV